MSGGLPVPGGPSEAAAIVLAGTAAEREQAYAVRLRVFVDEQRVPLELERDEHDERADHFLARVAGRPVGAARLLLDGAVAHVQRVAVLPELRGRGLGVALMAALERRAAERGARTVDLHAQLHARGFYERLGYAAYGEIFDDAGIDHIAMRKQVG